MDACVLMSALGKLLPNPVIDAVCAIAYVLRSDDTRTADGVSVCVVCFCLLYSCVVSVCVCFALTDTRNSASPRPRAVSCSQHLLTTIAHAVVTLPTLSCLHIALHPRVRCTLCVVCDHAVCMYVYACIVTSGGAWRACGSELELLTAFVQLVRGALGCVHASRVYPPPSDVDPDILVSYDTHHVALGFLVERASALEVCFVDMCDAACMMCACHVFPDTHACLTD
jgi:hypothetical protein